VADPVTRVASNSKELTFAYTELQDVILEVPDPSYSSVVPEKVTLGVALMVTGSELPTLFIVDAPLATPIKNGFIVL
jgi:hypothetical protein